MLVLPLILALQIAPYPASTTGLDVSERIAAVSSVKTLLDRELVDYPSSRFRNVKLGWYPGEKSSLGDIPGGWELCGEVNPKTSQGGFGGWRWFGYSLRSKALFVGTSGAVCSAVEGEDITPQIAPSPSSASGE